MFWISMMCLIYSFTLNPKERFMEIRSRFSKSLQDDLSKFMKDELHLFKNASHSSYAYGRQSAWLQFDCPLSAGGIFKPVDTPKRLWEWCEKVWQSNGMPGLPEVGLANYGDVGIDLHRDATYAAPDSLIINLGKVHWQYDWDRGISTPQHYNFDGGEVISFNCKHRHGAYDPASDRWSIVLWTISHKRRSEFEQVKNEKQLANPDFKVRYTPLYPDQTMQ